MMDAWEILTAGSTLTTGDAWEHLQAQGGGGTGTYLILADGLVVNITAGSYEVNMQEIELEASVGFEPLTVQVEASQFAISINGQELLASVNDDNYIVEVGCE
jgi:hypothetical protein